MAVLDFFPVVGFERATKITALGASASSAAQNPGSRTHFALIATGDAHIRFGDSAAIADATVADLLIRANTKETYGMGYYTHFKVFNPGGSGIDVYWIPLSKF